MFIVRQPVAAAHKITLKGAKKYLQHWERLG